jgi:hypothetical protein
MKQEIQPLPNGFRRGLWEYRRLERVGPIAIYERYHLGQKPSYETIIIRVQPPKTMPNGNVLPWREVYPAPSQWGKFAWSFQSAQAAKAKFRVLESCLRLVRRNGPVARQGPNPGNDVDTEPEELVQAQANLALAILEKEAC